ncbi:MAG: aldehyde dehydrogenase family protein, partial [Candidatus Omnitrophota bacterium]
REEIFGPVLAVIRFSSEEEAVRLANDSDFGLAAMVWTQDKENSERVAKALRCGTVWVNTYGGFYNEAPFGGYKQSGIGRELGQAGLWEYTLLKHINRDLSPDGRPLVANWFV